MSNLFKGKSQKVSERHQASLDHSYGLAKFTKPQINIFDEDHNSEGDIMLPMEIQRDLDNSKAVLLTEKCIKIARLAKS